MGLFDEVVPVDLRISYFSAQLLFLGTKVQRILEQLELFGTIILGNIFSQYLQVTGIQLHEKISI